MWLIYCLNNLFNFCTELCSYELSILLENTRHAKKKKKGVEIEAYFLQFKIKILKYKRVYSRANYLLKWWCLDV